MKKILFILCVLLVGLAGWYFYPEPKIPGNAVVDKIIVLKEKRELKVYQKGELLKTYRISLGFQPEGHKHFEGDGKTPEGIYKIDGKNPKSVCYLNLGISYPSKADKMYAAKHGKSPGGAIKIHGMHPGIEWLGKFHRWMDWSNGCICVTNPEMKELYDHVPVGTVIEIRP